MVQSTSLEAAVAAPRLTAHLLTGTGVADVVLRVSALVRLIHPALRAAAC